MKRIQNHRGSALLITLALMLLLTGVAMVAVNESTTDVQLSYNQMHEEQAFYLGEAGAQRALAQLNVDGGWRDGWTNVGFGDGYYSVDIKDSSQITGLGDTVIVLSTGALDGSEASIELTVVPRFIRPFQFAMFADAGINLDRETCTDSFNSDSGSYAATQADSLGDVGSNGTITSSKDVNFGGSIQTATAGGITLGANNTVTGDSTSTADSVALDIIPDSEFDWARDNSVAQTGITGTNFAYDPVSRALTMGSSAEIVLSSGVYYFSDIFMGKESNIALVPGAQVTIYVTGDINFNQLSTINDGGNPANMLVYSSGGRLQFDQGNTFYGAFYGPNAHIQYDQTTQVFGALVGNTIQLDRGACFHYDRNLANIRRTALDGVTLVAWAEVL